LGSISIKNRKCKDKKVRRTQNILKIREIETNNNLKTKIIKR
jgi:hypothetical protein